MTKTFEFNNKFGQCLAIVSAVNRTEAAKLVSEAIMKQTYTIDEVLK